MRPRPPRRPPSLMSEIAGRCSAALCLCLQCGRDLELIEQLVELVSIGIRPVEVSTQLVEEGADQTGLKVRFPKCQALNLIWQTLLR